MTSPLQLAQEALKDDEYYRTRMGTPTRDEGLDQTRMTREPALARAVIELTAERDQLRAGLETAIEFISECDDENCDSHRCRVANKLREMVGRK